jgi:hypothetical protein
MELKTAISVAANTYISFGAVEEFRPWYDILAECICGVVWMDFRLENEEAMLMLRRSRKRLAGTTGALSFIKPAAL